MRADPKRRPIHDSGAVMKLPPGPAVCRPATLGPGRCRSAVLRAGALLLLAALAGIPAVRADGPRPDLVRVSARIDLEADRWTRVRYEVEFVERHSRDGLSRWGPFESGFEIVRASATRDGEPVEVRLAPIDEACLAARFAEPTREASRYVLRLEYRFPGWPILPERSGLKVVRWRPTAWDLPVQRTELRLTLPVEVAEAAATGPVLCAEWARRQGIRVLQPEPHAEGAGFSTSPDESGKAHLVFHAEYWGVLPWRSRGVTIALPAQLLGEAEPALPAPSSESGREDATDEPGPRGDPGIHPRWLWAAGVGGSVAALFWLMWKLGGNAVRRVR